MHRNALNRLHKHNISANSPLLINLGMSFGKVLHVCDPVLSWKFLDLKLVLQLRLLKKTAGKDQGSWHKCGLNCFICFASVIKDKHLQKNEGMTNLQNQFLERRYYEGKEFYWVKSALYIIHLCFRLIINSDINTYAFAKSTPQSLF